MIFVWQLDRSLIDVSRMLDVVVLNPITDTWKLLEIDRELQE